MIAAIQKAQDLLPIAILGFDSDNGSEFINHGLINFCRDNQITFTRSRAYKKNDQAHVEERNGSVVRRTVGYDRYEGCVARDALQELYLTMRLYVNFFQPSMKLISKQRDGAKVSRQYDSAKTPYRRMLDASDVSKKTKSALRLMYSKLDPVALLQELEQLQDAFWRHAWRPNIGADVSQSESSDLRISIMPAMENELQLPTVKRTRSDRSPTVAATSQVKETEIPRKYRQTRKPRKSGRLHEWRTRKDPFENLAEEIERQFHQNQNITAKQLLTVLKKKSPGDYSDAQSRTLMRRLNKLRSSVDGQVIPSPSRQTYPKHIKSRSKLSPDQWQQVTKVVTARFRLNPEISVQELLSILDEKFPNSVSDAQIPTLRRRLKQLREAEIRNRISAQLELSRA